MTYDFSFQPGTPYENAVGLIRRHRRDDEGMVVDFGCGFGAIAEPVVESGLGYLGVDLDPESVARLRGRGMEALVADLTSPAKVFEDLERALAGRPVAALTMLDVIEHLTDGTEFLRLLSDFARRVGGPPLVVSIPNVTHLDLATKLLLGRWDVTRTGLLDATHVRFFSEQRIGLTLGAAGWAEIGADDFGLTYSDQHFPPGAIPLERLTPLGQLLSEVCLTANPTGTINQFIRAYAPCARPAGESDALLMTDGQRVAEPGPFLSVLVRTQGERPVTLHETLLSLAAQTCEDFEVLVLAHDVDDEALAGIEAVVGEFHPAFRERVRVVRVDGGGRARPLNVGADTARGQYLAMIDDDDIALAHWVELFQGAAREKPAHVLRVGVARQDVEGAEGMWSGQDGYRVLGKPKCEMPLEFDLVGHFYDNYTPNTGYAVPRSMVTDLNERWDEELPVLEDWDYLLRTATYCGVAAVPAFGALIRLWTNAANSLSRHSEEEWVRARRSVITRRDASPLLLPPGSVAQVRELLHQNAALKVQLHEVHTDLGVARHELVGLQAHVEHLYRTRSWRTAVALTRLGKVARGVLGPLGVLRVVRAVRRRRSRS